MGWKKETFKLFVTNPVLEPNTQSTLPKPLFCLPYSTVMPYLSGWSLDAPLTVMPPAVRGTFCLTREIGTYLHTRGFLSNWYWSLKILILLNAFGSAEKCCCVMRTSMSAMWVSRCPTFPLSIGTISIRHHGVAFPDPRTQAMACLISQRPLAIICVTLELFTLVIIFPSSHKITVGASWPAPA